MFSTPRWGHHIFSALPSHDFTSTLALKLFRGEPPVNDVQAAIENVGNIEVAKLEKGLTIMATISGEKVVPKRPQAFRNYK